MENNQKGTKIAWIGASATILAALITGVISIINTSSNSNKNDTKLDKVDNTQIKIDEIKGDFIQGDKVINQYETKSSEKTDISERKISIEDISMHSDFKTEGYKIAQSFKLNEFSNGINGALLLLIDDSIPNELKGGIERYGSYRALLYPQFYPFEGFDPNADYSNFEEAVLLIINNNLQVLYTENLGHQFARVDRLFIHKERNKPTFVVTTNFAQGWGSYSGPYSKFIEINKNGIEYIIEGGLLCSLKSQWWISENEGKNLIIEKSCFPKDDLDLNGDVIFEITIEKYSYDNGKWIKTVSKEDGFWESEGINSL
ncbi:hypothetical protein [Flexithrix dorotheae]|uniref:hypothetical protein n=1 Tax=Flexithrix dorotheae TaxID=70993 RepID=UPI00036B614D|nr:hypothetical protein [Flexithrix dorotheae]